MKRLYLSCCLLFTACVQTPVPDVFPDAAVFSWLNTCATTASDYSTFCKVARATQVSFESADNYNSGPTLVVVSNVGMDAYLTNTGQSADGLIGNSSAATAFFADYVLKGNITKTTAIKNLNNKTVQVSSTASGVVLNGIAVQTSQTLSSGAPLLFINQTLF